MSTKDCDTCDGTGLVRKRPTNAIDLVPCEDCAGSGLVHDDDDGTDED